ATARQGAAAAGGSAARQGGTGDGDDRLVGTRESAYAVIAELEGRLAGWEAEARKMETPPPTLANQIGIVVIVAIEVAIAIAFAGSSGTASRSSLRWPSTARRSRRSGRSAMRPSSRSPWSSRTAGASRGCT